MNRILNFVREKAFVLILLGSIAAAIGTGFWAIRTVQQSLNENGLLDNAQSEELWDTQREGDGLWEEPADIVTDEMNGEVAMEPPAASQQANPATKEEKDVAQSNADGSDAQSTPPESSTQSVGESSWSEPSEPSAVLEPPAVAVAPSFVLPVSGSEMQAFSGDELVYNETLGDWRTHNGVDYEASLGEEIIAPIVGEITAITIDGNWGGVVELCDAKGYTWRFCGVEESSLSVGDAVEIGQVLGHVGEISAESGAEPHLHLEILQDGTYQDPSHYLK